MGVETARLANLSLASDSKSDQLVALAASVCSNLSEWIQNKCNQNNSNQSIQTATTLNSFTTNSKSPPLSDVYFSHQNNHQDALSASPLTKIVANYLLEPMQQLDSKLDYYFSDIWINSGDERTSKLPFMAGGPWKLVYATLIYLYLIKWLLPRIMRPLKPFELNWSIRVYNLFMVLSNMWAFYHGARILNFGIKCFGCEVINHRDYSPHAIELLHYGWLFFLSRLIEWLDTIFFVLRKKERQVTKLHVFHHSFVPLISWTYLKYHPGYTVAFFPLVNTFVHSIMYTYYLLATFGPSIQPYLWWKRYLTSLQIAQFVLILIQLASIPLTGDEKCQYPLGFLYVAFAGAILFLWLFYTYYVDTYGKRKTDTANQTRRKNQAANGEIDRSIGGLPTTKLSSPNYQSKEGSSRALSDVIENAIDCEDSILSNENGHHRNKKFV